MLPNEVKLVVSAMLGTALFSYLFLAGRKAPARNQLRA
jgi:hypothetical protein